MYTRNTARQIGDVIQGKHGTGIKAHRAEGELLPQRHARWWESLRF